MKAIALRWCSVPMLRPIHWAALLAALSLVAIFSLPFIPIDETRYVSVAWEMWHQGSFLVPLKNGLPYSDKPPLLFWMIHAGWAVFGVNDWWPRVISPVAAFVALLQLRSLAMRLWPERATLADTAPIVLLGTVLWVAFSQALMFDILLACWVLLGIQALVALVQKGRWRWWGAFAIAIGCGVLTKGPVVLLHLLPPALLVPWWAAERPRPGRWYASLLVAVLVGAVIALAWAIPAALAGGERYRAAIFLHQTVDRVASGAAPHRREFWWYLMVLPVLLFPWSAWPPVYRGLVAVFRQRLEQGVRLALSWALPTLIGFSLVRGKQVHYLIPDLPAYALMIACGVEASTRDERPWGPALALLALAAGLVVLGARRADLLYGLPVSAWLAPAIALIAALWLVGPPQAAQRQISSLTVGVLLLIAAIDYWGVRAIRPAFDVAPIAKAIATLQGNGKTVAHLSDYDDEFQFPGRLVEPLALVEPATFDQWATAHPQAFVVVEVGRDYDAKGLAPVIDQPYLKRRLLLLSAPDAVRVFRAGAMHW
jgi:4-amino-4-deoxy-L-arabinose transferase-like glycosyltransferase